MSLRFQLLVLFACSLFLAGCGTGGTNLTPAAPSSNSAQPAPAPLPSPSPSPATSAGAVTVIGGQDIGGADINVTSPLSSPVVNAQMLGVAQLGMGGFASNTGDTIHRGAHMKVLMFGAGLNGGMVVALSGPNDIAISNIRSINATDGSQGVAFDVAVAGNAALGARTVRLKDVTNDITTFTGGLEVVP